MQWGELWEARRERYRSPHGTEWVRWFAWYPVRTEPPNDRYIWLEWVEWRRPDGFTYNLPEYRVVDQRKRAD